MSSNRKVAFALAALLIALVALTGCVQPEPVVVEREVERIVTQEVEVVTEVMVTPTPAPVVQGGVWVDTTSADASILNPILGSDTASSGIYNYLFPSLLGVNPQSGAFEATEMAERWETSEDGLTWTFYLRDGVVWSDGDPVDAADFKFTYDAIASDLVETPRKSNVAGIESIEVIDPLTIQVTFTEVKCDGLSDVGLGWLPSHLYAADFSDIMENDLNEAPTASAGPFVFGEWVRDDNTTMLRNETYFKGAPYMDGRIRRVIPDPGARLAALQTGEVDYIGVQPEQLTTVQLDPNLNLYKFKDDGYSYIALNLANPENPLPGQDEEGNLIEQDPHPILSDVNVRKAIAHSLDYNSIISRVYLGQGYQLAANVLPAVEWAHDPSILPYDFDTELAASILDEAGWVDSDEDGIRDKDGEPLSLTLLTNSGNTTREDLGVLVQDQLNSIGFDITFEAIDFGTMVGQMLGQTYDMVIIGWTGLGTDPNDDAFWHTQYDTPESGFNFVSYSNPRINELLEQGVAVPGCAPEDRAPFYQEIQQIIHDDVPYVFVTGSVGNWAYSSKFDGVAPGPWSLTHNIEKWSLAQ
jgi:peptide/nickel transport system substrate-binding protein